jgi:hypothetical protein
MEMLCEYVNWIGLAQVKILSRTSVIAVMEVGICNIICSVFGLLNLSIS